MQCHEITVLLHARAAYAACVQLILTIIKPYMLSVIDKCEELCGRWL